MVAWALAPVHRIKIRCYNFCRSFQRIKIRCYNFWRSLQRIKIRCYNLFVPSGTFWYLFIFFNGLISFQRIKIRCYNLFVPSGTSWYLLIFQCIRQRYIKPTSSINQIPKRAIGSTQIVGLEFIPDHKRRIWLKPSILPFFQTGLFYQMTVNTYR